MFWMLDAYNSYDGYGYYDGPNYAAYNDKSQAAIRRENEAMELFKKRRIEIEGQAEPQRVTIQLLEPSCHLTSACWSSFNRHVKSHPGWSAKRRVATPEEKRAAKQTRKGKVYFVDVTYDLPLKPRTTQMAPVVPLQPFKKQASPDIPQGKLCPRSKGHGASPNSIITTIVGNVEPPKLVSDEVMADRHIRARAYALGIPSSQLLVPSLNAEESTLEDETSEPAWKKSKTS